jgi:hypothetical protein
MEFARALPGMLCKDMRICGYGCEYSSYDEVNFGRVVIITIQYANEDVLKKYLRNRADRITVP